MYDLTFYSSSITQLESHLNESRYSEQRNKQEIALQNEEIEKNHELIKRIRRKLLLVSKVEFISSFASLFGLFLSL